MFNYGFWYVLDMVNTWKKRGSMLESILDWTWKWENDGTWWNLTTLIIGGKRKIDDLNGFFSMDMHLWDIVEDKLETGQRYLTDFAARQLFDCGTWIW